MKYFIIVIAVLFAMQSCSWFQKYPGYSKTKTGIYYKLIKIGEKVAPPKVSDFVTVDLKYITQNDSVFFTGMRTFQLTKPEFKGAIDECFLMLSTGDSATFIIDAQQFFEQTIQAKLPHFIRAGEPMKVAMRMDEIRTQQQYEKDKTEFLKWIEDFGEYEKLILARFIKSEKIDITPTESGMYFITTCQGTGKPVEAGDLVTVNYEGKFLNGKFFDSTHKRKQPFEFVYGTEMQVIPGLEEAIGRMREGEKAVVILPSDLAWGEKGSSTGIIPPFTSVIYEVELVSAVTRNLDSSENNE